MEEGSIEQTMPIPVFEEPKQEEPTTVKVYTRKFWVKGTADQLRALGQYMKDNGIEYGGIE